MVEHSISDTDISVIFEPQDADPIVDIVFVHGLQGHPYKTWASKGDGSAEASPPLSGPEPNKQRRRKALRRLIQRRPKSSSDIQQEQSSLDHGDPDREGLGSFAKYLACPALSVFWPADLLPVDCPQARIMTWGYDTKITKYMAASVNQNTIFSHSKDLLFALQRMRVVKRPLVFVAHSLGGIIVKEMLARSYMSPEEGLLNIVKSTYAIVFLGTPHRGSKDLANVGEMARKVASAILMDTNSAMLDSLGLKNSDLERCQDSFSRLWTLHGFQVKTFQEGFPVTGVRLGLLNEKIVPEFSSLLGDSRERAETLDANHMEMCRFRSDSESNYRKVSGELKSICRSIEASFCDAKLPSHRSERQGSEISRREFSLVEKACLQSLRFPEMETRQQTIDRPMEETCRWLLQNPTYKAWRNRQNLEMHNGLLWIKGKPGSGKSTLMREISRTTEQQKAGENISTASFFFNASGQLLERSPLGLFRSLLYQLLPQSRDAFRKFLALYRHKEKNTDQSVMWPVGQLRTFFDSIFTQPGVRRTIIFIDALDECSEDIRDIVYFFRSVTTSAFRAGAQLDVCLSSRQYPTVTIRLCPEVVVQDFNGSDIAYYVEQKFAASGISSDERWANLVREIIKKSSGVFLWVVLVIDILLRDRDDGKNIKHLEKRVTKVPQALEELFAQIVRGITSQQLRTTVRFFQWALLAGRTLRLREWHHVLAFIRGTPPTSLHAWRESEDYTENDQQLELRIRSISKGLVEVKAKQDSDVPAQTHDEWGSVFAGAGSLDIEYGENRVVQFIHESVRGFFLHNNGFSFLDPSIGSRAIGEGHLSILNTCFDYIGIIELDELCKARLDAGSLSSASPPLSSFFTEWRSASNKSRRIHEKGLGEAGFGTSASNYTSSVHSNSSAGSATRPAADLAVTNAVIPMESQDGIIEDATYALRQFLGDPIIAAPPEALEEAVIYANAAQSVAGQSQVLEHLPALLSYSLEMVSFHASSAEKAKANPKNLVERLHKTSIWRRWLSLQESLSLSTTLLHFSAEWNLESWIQCLFDLGVPCDTEGGECGKPLIAAVKGSNKEAMILLLEHGAEMTSHDRKQRSPLHYIAATNIGLLRAFWGYLESKMSTLVLPSCATIINATDVFGQTALHLAVWQSNDVVVNELLKYGANVNAEDNNGDTPLHFACERDPPNLKICKTLLDAGADTFSENRQLKLPFQVASESRFAEAAHLISDHQQNKALAATIVAPWGLLTLKVVEARRLQKCREPYAIAVFQKSEIFSTVAHGDDQKEDEKGKFGTGNLWNVLRGRDSNQENVPHAMKMRSRQSSNGSVASLGDYRSVKLGANTKTTTCPRWDLVTCFDVVGTDSVLDISIYDRGSTVPGTSNDEFIGFVRLEPQLKEISDAPICGWYPLTDYDQDGAVDRGDIYVEATFQKTEKKHYGPNDFEILKLIGKGRSGQVYQVRKKGTKQKYALKAVSRDRILLISASKHHRAGLQATLDEQRIFVREIASQSPFILSSKFSYETPADLHIIVDYISGGELFWHLCKEGRFEERRAKFYIAEIIIALQYLHHYGIESYILKPESILLDANGHISLCDFGLGKSNPKQETDAQEYFAPEIVADVTSYTKVAHFWSLGVLAFEMTCGWSPFYSEDTEELHKNIQHMKVRFPRDCLTIEGRRFIKRLLIKDPTIRLGSQGGAEELKNHPFFADTDWDRLSQKLVAPPFKPKIDPRHSGANPDFSGAFDVDSASLNMRAAALAQGFASDQPLSPGMQANFKGFTFVDESDLNAGENMEYSDNKDDFELFRDNGDGGDLTENKDNTWNEGT